MVKMSIKPSDIDIEWSSYARTIVQKITLPGCRLVPNTLSCLRAEDEFVSFRVQTEPLTGLHGSFSREIIPMTFNENGEQRTINESTAPNIIASNTCQISCHCCGNELARYHVQRVLPLPSGNLDSSEWFCHGGHGHGTKFSLAPHSGDLLYGPCYFLMSKEWLQPSALNSNDTRVARCKRCLAWLGTSVTSHITLWNCTVSIDDSSCSSPLQDFIKCVAHAITSCVGLMCRVIVETQVMEEETQYILLWIIDKNLQILTNSEAREIHCADNNSFIETVLKPQNTVKLLYLHQSCFTSVVKAWQDDVSVQCINVAKSMFTDGLEHMRKMTKCIPQPYRVTNNFFTAYLQV
ncbi:hypothetical protein R5R35_008673 [Gryllus longicercus]